MGKEEKVCEHGNLLHFLHIVFSEMCEKLLKCFTCSPISDMISIVENEHRKKLLIPVINGLDISYVY